MQTYIKHQTDATNQVMYSFLKDRIFEDTNFSLKYLLDNLIFSKGYMPLVRKDGHMMYDIHLSMGCRSLPDMKDLVGEIPVLNNSAFQQKLLIPSPSRPGFLGLDLPEPLAKALFQRLKSTRAAGYWLLSAYREPRISKDLAALFAEQALSELSIEHYQQHPDDTLGPLFFVGEKPEFWVFKAPSEKFRDREGSGIWISIDKIDGHIWTREDFAVREKRMEEAYGIR
jgi:hypothetical protein